MISGGNKCKASLHTMKSRLVRGDKLISESSSPDYFGLLVEVLSSFKIEGRSRYEDGFLILTCNNIPVNFTVDPAGNVKGSLLGYMRPCEYIYQKKFPVASF
ncbi:hypothetical protein CARUB_v10003035mg [Capsella rubella]|uniref:Uncharacterized protein n=1 Tax=Capsella rubella TaxID=81985 RepID=R0HBJ3_9BRAS|nr:uncharacterized protein LOC17881234 [Capsella rubella]EOA22400.1 hypothetical protein CARUB_v10003035mg [Capsella rubella]